MVGEAINGEKATLAAQYSCGAYFFQMKVQNPGIDILSNLNWRCYLDGSEVIHDKDLPPLSGTLTSSDAQETAASGTHSTVHQASFSLKLHGLVFLVGCLVIANLFIASSHILNTRNPP